MVEAEGAKALCIAGDVGDDAFCKSVVQKTMAHFGMDRIGEIHNVGIVDALLRWIHTAQLHVRAVSHAQHVTTHTSRRAGQQRRGAALQGDHHGDQQGAAGAHLPHQHLRLLLPDAYVVCCGQMHAAELLA
jgi:hypothetical protein